MIRRVLLIAVASLAALLAAIGVMLTIRHQPPRPTASTALTSHGASWSHRSPDPHPHFGGPIVGVYEHAPLTSWQPELSFGSSVGVHVNAALIYTNMGTGFPYRFAHAAYLHGAQVIIQIQPYNYSLREIASGKDDAWLRTYASEVRSFGAPVIIGFAHEVNGSWYPWGYRHQPAWSFVAAWRHVVTIFSQQAARNVKWLWTVSAARRAAPLKDYWPGSSYVTWVGLDGYYYNAAQNFSRVFGEKVIQLRRFTSDPILLAEVGIGPVAGQSAKMPDLFAGIRKRHLLGLVWFDEAQHHGPFHQDWRLEGHHAAMVAFRRGVESLNTG